MDPGSVSNGHVYLLEDETDSSTNGNTGNLIGAPQVVDGLTGKAMKYNGVDDGIHLPDAATINTSTRTDKTVIAVFNCDDVSKTEKQVVYEEGGTTRGLNIYVAHEGEIDALRQYKDDQARQESEWAARWEAHKAANPGVSEEKLYETFE